MIDATQNQEKENQMDHSSRILRFRAWDKNLKRMWSWEELQNLPMKDFEREDLEWLQFTGLLDKNGKEIFEGDIIWAGVFSDKTGEKLSGVISWDEKNRFRSAHKWYMGGYTITRIKNSIIDFDNESKWEIIGDIYQNPELLKQ